MFQLFSWKAFAQTVPFDGNGFTYDRAALLEMAGDSGFDLAWLQADAAVAHLIKESYRRGGVGIIFNKGSRLIYGENDYVYDPPIPSGIYSLAIELNELQWLFSFQTSDRSAELTVQRRPVPFHPFVPEHGSLQSQLVLPDIGLSDVDLLINFQCMVVMLCRHYGFSLPPDQYKVIVVYIM